MCLKEQGKGSSKEVVEVLHGDVSGACVVHLYSYHVLVCVGVAAEGGQEVAHAAFRRKVAVEKAKPSSIVCVARLLQVP
jgi:hypothetical protein